MSLPTRGEEYTKVIEHLIKAQESCNMLAHLENAQGNTGTLIAKGWLGIAELLRKMQHQVIQIAKGKLQ